MPQTQSTTNRKSKPTLIAAAALLAVALIAAAGCSDEKASNANSIKPAADQATVTPDNQPSVSTDTEETGNTANSNGKNQADNAANSSQPEETSPETAENPYAVAGVTDLKAFKQMVEAVKAAAASDSKETLAKYVIYPMNVNANGKSTKIATKEEFVAQYDSIMTAPIKQALAAQKVDDMFANYKGVMVGDGEVWFGVSAGTPEKYGIIAVNLPDADTETKTGS